jgi:hypothetical protein
MAEGGMGRLVALAGTHFLLWGSSPWTFRHQSKAAIRKSAAEGVTQKVRNVNEVDDSDSRMSSPRQWHRKIGASLLLLVARGCEPEVEGRERRREGSVNVRKTRSMHAEFRGMR